MASLKVYNDIVGEFDKVILRDWYGIDGVCFNDVDEFIASIKEEDNTIQLYINCDGGSVIEGWCIYDKLRASGKEISTIVEGKAASMATVLMMAAPKERRYATPSSRFLVHNPWIDPAMIGCTATADDLANESQRLKEEQDRILNLYVERCGVDREEMQALMNEDKWVDCNEALRLGLIGSVLAPASAKLKTTKTKPQNKQMEKVEIKSNTLARLLKMCGLASVEDVKAMTLNTAEGGEVEVDREEGEPQVGDAASPDGEWLMPDGSTIVIADGVITEIRPAEVEEEVEEKAEAETEETTEEVVEEVEEDNEIEELKKRIEELEAENEELKKQLEGAQANAKTNEEMQILNAVAIAGGKKALAKLSSSFTPATRVVGGKQVSDKADINETLRNFYK